MVAGRDVPRINAFCEMAKPRGWPPERCGGAGHSRWPARAPRCPPRASDRPGRATAPPGGAPAAAPVPGWSAAAPWWRPPAVSVGGGGGGRGNRGKFGNRSRRWGCIMQGQCATHLGGVILSDTVRWGGSHFCGYPVVLLLGGGGGRRAAPCGGSGRDSSECKPPRPDCPGFVRDSGAVGSVCRAHVQQGSWGATKVCDGVVCLARIHACITRKATKYASQKS